MSTDWWPPGTPAKIAFFSLFVACFAAAQGDIANGASGGVTPAQPLAEAAAPTPLAPPGGAQWIRYAAILAIVVVLVVLYARGYR